MKILFPLTALVLLLVCCNNASENKTSPVEKQAFFPVTSFLKGEIYTIKKMGINPLKTTTVGNQTDSTWLKAEELDDALKAFLEPEIDSANLTDLFTEKSFFDQSINAITFIYEATATLPQTMKLVTWNIYIDPQSGTVKRIYMVKDVDKSTLQQLTWVTGQWCKITTIVSDEKGASTIKKEEKITWDF